MDLQGVQSRNLQISVIVQELLQHRLQGQQKLLLLIQLLFGRCRQLLFVTFRVDLVQNELQKTENNKEYLSETCSTKQKKS